MLCVSHRTFTTCMPETQNIASLLYYKHIILPVHVRQRRIGVNTHTFNCCCGIDGKCNGFVCQPGFHRELHALFAAIF